MQNLENKRFLYSAYSNSIGAVVQEPWQASLLEVPSAAIPVTGGHISHTKEDISFSVGSFELVKIGRASATVLGHKTGSDYSSVSIAKVEKLNILDVITADVIVSRVTSVYPVQPLDRENDKKRAPKNQPDDGFHKATFHLGGSHFENLKIDGKLIDCKIDPDPTICQGFKIKKGEANHRSLFGEACQEIQIPQFGTIYLGELDTYGAKVILTMLRVELGCPIKGPITCCSASTNGGDGK